MRILEVNVEIFGEISQETGIRICKWLESM